MGFFPVDEETCRYLTSTGRTEEQVQAFRNYFKAQEMFGLPRLGDIDYSETLALDLGSIQPALAGPRRPQDRIDLPAIKETFQRLMTLPPEEGGFGKDKDALGQRHKIENGGTRGTDVGHGDVLIAAITSCTNTSNPSVMLAAGLVAKKAVELGMKVKSTVKTSLGPGSRAVTDYLEQTGLQDHLNQLGFQN